MFKKITLDDIDIVKPYLQTTNHQNCVFTFGNNNLWDKEKRLYYTIIDDVFLYRAIYEHEIRYCTPDFKGKWKKIIDFIDKDAQQIGKKYRISGLQLLDVNYIKKNMNEKYNIVFKRNDCDYIYEVESLATLNGRIFNNKRNLINSFYKNYQFSYEQLSLKNLEECWEFEKSWMQQKQDKVLNIEAMNSLKLEQQAIDFALKHFKELEFEGGIIRIDGQIKAFAIGEELNKETFVLHFEKADRSIHGLYQVINKLFVMENLLGKYLYVNREEDMGIENIRQSKLSYRPFKIYEKYTAYNVGGMKDA